MKLKQYYGGVDGQETIEVRGLPSPALIMFGNNTIGGTVMGVFGESSDTIVWNTSVSNNYVAIGSNSGGRLCFYKSSGKYYIKNTTSTKYYYIIDVFG